MDSGAEEAPVVHNAGANRFELQLNGELAVLEYQLRGNRMIVTHTGVPEAFEGRGIASRLAKAALEHAKEKSYKVVPACQFMTVYLKRHPEYKPLTEA